MRRSVAAVGALCMALPVIAAPAAQAETRTLRGTIDGNPGSRLIIKVQRVGGDPFVIKSFAFKRVAFTCFGSAPSGRIGGTVVRMKVRKDVNPFDPKTRANVYSSSTSKPREATEDGEITLCDVRGPDEPEGEDISLLPETLVRADPTGAGRRIPTLGGGHTWATGCRSSSA